MTDQSDPLPRRIAWFAPWTWKRRWWVTAALLAVLVAYPLSVGPACGLCHKGWISRPLYDAFYTPLVWIAMKDRRITLLLIWYVNLFLF